MFLMPYSSFPGTFLSLSLFCSLFVVDYVAQRRNSSNSFVYYYYYFCFSNAQSCCLKSRGETKHVDVALKKKLGVNIVSDLDFGGLETRKGAFGELKVSAALMSVE